MQVDLKVIVVREVTLKLTGDEALAVLEELRAMRCGVNTSDLRDKLAKITTSTEFYHDSTDD